MTTTDRRELIARAMYETPGHLYKRNVTWDDTGIKGLDEDTIRLSIKQQFRDMAASALAVLEPWLMPDVPDRIDELHLSRQPDGSWICFIDDQFGNIMHDHKAATCQEALAAAIRAALEVSEYEEGDGDA